MDRHVTDVVSKGGASYQSKNIKLCADFLTKWMSDLTETSCVLLLIPLVICLDYKYTYWSCVFPVRNPVIIWTRGLVKCNLLEVVRLVRASTTSFYGVNNALSASVTLKWVGWSLKCSKIYIRINWAECNRRRSLNAILRRLYITGRAIDYLTASTGDYYFHLYKRAPSDSCLVSFD